MTKRIMAVACIAFLGLSTTTGCIGGMATSGRVMKFNLSVAEGKWARECVFVLLYVIPVYPFAGMIDLLIVNSIEFHTGTNPLSGKARVAQVGETRREVAPDGAVVHSTLREDGSVDVVVNPPDGDTRFMNFATGEDRVVARDERGNELGVATRDGGLELTAVTR